MRSSTRSAPSALAFSIEHSISPTVSHANGVHTRRLLLNAINVCVGEEKETSGGGEIVGVLRLLP